MVILVPKLGVLCIEVKGCPVSRKDGKWIYPYETSYEGPFKQASKAMHSLRSYLAKQDPTLNEILFFSAAVFTAVEFNEQSPEWHDWQYINRSQFLRKSISSNITGILERAHTHVGSKTGIYSWYDTKASRPSEKQLQKMVQLLRDNFEYTVSNRVDIERLETAIVKFTEEQYDALDYLQDNERIIFRGPAGTGKTFLALETARRALEEGKAVLFLCFNRLLGEWLKAQTSELNYKNHSFFCGTFHSLLLGVYNQVSLNVSNDFWEKILPSRVVDLLLSDNRSWPMYDLLIIDEAQDFVREEYLDVLDLMLKGGLTGGRWAFFGDFEKQAIYATDAAVSNFHRSLDERARHHVNYSLRINCRNAGPIAETLCITSGMAPGYKKIIYDAEGSDVDPIFYDTKKKQILLLKNTLIKLLKNFTPKEIVILSMRNNNESCAFMLHSLQNECEGFTLIPASKNIVDNAISFCSIHSFKGLEAPAIIITDINSLDDDRSRSLLYVGMSRARVRLFMLMSESCRKGYDKILNIGLAKSFGR